MEPSEGRFETAIPKIIHRDLGKIQNDDACVKDIVDFLRIIRLSRGVVVAVVAAVVAVTVAAVRTRLRTYVIYYYDRYYDTYLEK